MKFIAFIILFFISSSASLALTKTPSHATCPVTDKLCVMEQIKTQAEKIENKSWRDKTYRELAKAYTHEGHEDKAIVLIDKIETPDTKAMTIRGIGMAAADNKWNDTERYKALFDNLTAEAEKIDHPPSLAIAYTYIAMAQAFAGDDEGAFNTAKSMENDALRNKAFGESAEIQAERGDYDAAMESIRHISSLAFRNKAYGLVANIFTKAGELDKAYNAAIKIDNAYAKAQALQNIVNYGNEEESIAP